MNGIELIKEIEKEIGSLSTSRFSNDSNIIGQVDGLKKSIKILKKFENENAEYEVEDLSIIYKQKFEHHEIVEEKYSASGGSEVLLSFSEGHRILIYVDNWGTVNIERD